MEASVNQSGWASDDDGNRWFVGEALAGHVAVGRGAVTWLAAQERQRVARAEFRTFTVSGSNGAVHTVSQSRAGWRCTCKGFQFRKACKHTKAAQ